MNETLQKVLGITVAYFILYYLLLYLGEKDILEVATQIAKLEKGNGLNVSEEDAISDLKFGLVEVVYEWACGKVSFEQMCLSSMHARGLENVSMHKPS